MSGSLHGRLLGVLGGGSLLIWLVLGAWQYRQLTATVDALFDAHIVEAAESLHAMVRSEAVEHMGSGAMTRELERFVLGELARHGQGPLYGRDHFYAVRFGNTGEAYSSPGWPGEALLEAAGPGLATRSAKGAAWRVFTLATDGAEGPLAVSVCEPLAVRAPLIRDLSRKLGLALLGGLLLLLIALRFGVRWALRPLAEIAAEVGQRDPQHLEALSATDVPREIAPLHDALNALLVRLDEALAAEQQFTADAAHELRHPLAALKIHAQVAARAPQAEQRDAALAALLEGVERAVRLVEQLLTLARVDPAHDPEGMTDFALGEVVTECLHAARDAAAARQVRLRAEVPDDLRMRAHAAALAIALGNLIDNAIRHGPAGGEVVVSATRGSDGQCALQVTDQGPSIPAAEREAVLRRFHRLPGTTANGSGLGLAIVRRIARLHGASLHLADAPGGGPACQPAFPRPVTQSTLCAAMRRRP